MTLKISNLQVPLWGQPVNDDLQTELSGSGETAQPPVTRSHQQHEGSQHSPTALRPKLSIQMLRPSHLTEILGFRKTNTVSVNIQG